MIIEFKLDFYVSSTIKALKNPLIFKFHLSTYFIKWQGNKILSDNVNRTRTKPIQTQKLNQTKHKPHYNKTN